MQSKNKTPVRIHPANEGFVFPLPRHPHRHPHSPMGGVVMLRPWVNAERCRGSDNVGSIFSAHYRYFPITGP